MAQTQTHHLEFGDVVRKRYASWERGEHEREWTGLQLLSRYAPGLAPLPLGRETEAGTPVVIMSRLPGEPLDRAPLTPQETAGMTAAYRRLFSIRPPADLPQRDYSPAEFLAETTDWIAELRGADLSACQDPQRVREALTAAGRWLAAAPAQLGDIVDPVVAQGDGNVANMLWDDGECRLVDFEAFGVGELTFEVADLVEHASSRLRRLLDPATVLDAFDLSDAQSNRVVAYRILLACFWLGMLTPGNRGFVRNPEGSVEDQAAHVLALLDG